MDARYWKDKWESGDIFFHREEPHAQLVAYFSKLGPQKVMVPLCGKSNDLVWLHAKGHEVVGIELSAIACETFFTENKLPFEQSCFDGGTLFQGDRISLWCADFFTVPKAAWEGCTAVYDRAALVALPLTTRQKYTEHLTRSLGMKAAAKTFILLITLEYASAKPLGPPYSVDEKEVRHLYEKDFDIHLLHSERDNSLSNRPPKFTGIEVTERTYGLMSR